MSLRQSIAREVRGLVSETRPGDAPAFTRGEGLYGRDAVARRVHGDVSTMMIGGMAALLMQMLHPHALAGVWDHSNFRADMQGRLRRTARFIAVTTYATGEEAEAAIAHVRRIHEGVTGRLPDGTPYAATDPEPLTWVHAAEAWCFLAAYRRYRAPAISGRDQDRYYRETAELARRLGAVEVPESRAQLDAYFRRMRPRLRYDSRVREMATVLLGHRAPRLALMPFNDLTKWAAVDLLPDWARRMHRLDLAPGARALVRFGAGGVTRVVNWAMAG